MDSLKFLKGENKPWWLAGRAEISVSLTPQCGCCGCCTQTSLVGYLPFALLASVVLRKKPMPWEVRYWGKMSQADWPHLKCLKKNGRNKNCFMRGIWPVVETIWSFGKQKTNCTCWGKWSKPTRLVPPLLSWWCNWSVKPFPAVRWVDWRLRKPCGKVSLLSPLWNPFVIVTIIELCFLCLLKMITMHNIW